MSEDSGPDWARDKADEEDGIRLQRTGERVEVELREHQAGDNAVDKEVVPPPAPVRSDSDKMTVQRSVH